MMNLLALLATAAALGDATRLRMMLRLGSGPVSVGQLGASVGVTSPSVTHHVRKLREAGLVVAVRQGRRTIVRRVERRWTTIIGALGGSA